MRGEARKPVMTEATTLQIETKMVTAIQTQFATAVARAVVENKRCWRGREVKGKQQTCDVS